MSVSLKWPEKEKICRDFLELRAINQCAPESNSNSCNHCQQHIKPCKRATATRRPEGAGYYSEQLRPVSCS